MQTALVVLEFQDLMALGIARKIANAGGQPIIVICLSKDQRHSIDGVSDLGDELPDLVRETQRALDTDEETNPELIDCRGMNLRRALLDACSEKSVEQLVICVDRERRDSAMFALKRRIARTAPIDTLTVDPDGVKRPSRVLIPQIDGGGRDALLYASRYLSGAGCAIVAIPDDRAEARSRRVYQKARDRIPEPKRDLVSQLETAGPLEETIRSLVVDDDLVLASVQSARELEHARSLLIACSGTSREARVAYAIYRDENAASPGWLERWYERVRSHAPALSRDERRDLNDLLDRGGRLSTEFIVMMMLSTGIATLGLIQSSPAVVIGAMLVAPLMTPLVAIGLSLVQANTMLFRRAARAMLVGIIGALLVSMTIGMLSPWSELSSEVLARGSPNVFDLVIALLSGVAAAFALSRPGLAGTLVGVAIAVALVPPLAAMGISTVKGHHDVALGAGVLFTTNLFAIVVGAAMVFRFFGLDASLRGSRSPRWVRAVVFVILVGLLPVCAVLVHNLVGQIHQGVHRPYARPLPASLRGSIRARVAESEGMELISMTQSELEDDFGILVLLICAEPGLIDPDLETDILSRIYAEFGDNARARVRVLLSPVP